MNYSSIEKIRPRWREKWQRPLFRLGGSLAIIIPKPILQCFGKRTGKRVSIGWVVDELTGKDFLVINFDE